MAKYNFAKFEVQFLNHENKTEVQVGLIPALTFQEAVVRLEEYYGEDLVSVTVEPTFNVSLVLFKLILVTYCICVLISLPVLTCPTWSFTHT